MQPLCCISIPTESEIFQKFVELQNIANFMWNILLLFLLWFLYKIWCSFYLISNAFFVRSLYGKVYRRKRNKFSIVSNSFAYQFILISIKFFSFWIDSNEYLRLVYNFSSLYFGHSPWQHKKYLSLITNFVPHHFSLTLREKKNKENLCLKLTPSSVSIAIWSCLNIFAHSMCVFTLK